MSTFSSSDVATGFFNFFLKHELVHMGHVHVSSYMLQVLFLIPLSVFSPSVCSMPPFLCVSCMRRHAGLDAKRSLASV